MRGYALLSLTPALCLTLARPFAHLMPTLSVVVITKNEEPVLGRCLASANFADQLVVLDSGSTDRTLDVARTHDAEVSINTDWQGFGRQKNRAVQLARCDWVLVLDADEYLSEALREQIRAIVSGATQPRHVAYAMPRRSSFCGQFMRGNGWYPDRVTRLFQRGSAQFSNDLAHERLIVQGATGRLSGDLMHESYVSLEELLEKLNRYSSARAQDLHSQGRRSGLLRALGHGLWAFLRSYLLRRGFLDGRLGLVLAISIAEGTYYRHLKLWLSQRQQPT